MEPSYPTCIYIEVSTCLCVHGTSSKLQTNLKRKKDSLATRQDTTKLLIALSVAGDEVFLPLGVLFSPFFFGGTYEAKHGKAKVMEQQEILSESDSSPALAFIRTHMHATLPPTVYKQLKGFAN